MHSLWGPMKVFMRYWECIWRRESGTAWLLQLSLLEKKTLDFHELPGKNKQASNEQKPLSGKVQVTGPWCGNWKLLSEGTYVNRYSAVIPKTCGSCKNNPLPPPLHHEPLPLSSHTAQSTGRQRCVFSWGCPLGYDACVSEHVCACVRQGLSLLMCQGPQHCKWHWFGWHLNEWCSFTARCCAI